MYFLWGLFIYFLTFCTETVVKLATSYAKTPMWSLIAGSEWCHASPEENGRQWNPARRSWNPSETEIPLSFHHPVCMNTTENGNALKIPAASSHRGPTQSRPSLNHRLQSLRAAASVWGDNKPGSVQTSPKGESTEKKRVKIWKSS